MLPKLGPGQPRPRCRLSDSKNKTVELQRTLPASSFPSASSVSPPASPEHRPRTRSRTQHAPACRVSTGSCICCVHGRRAARQLETPPTHPIPAKCSVTRPCQQAATGNGPTCSPITCQNHFPSSRLPGLRGHLRSKVGRALLHAFAQHVAREAAHLRSNAVLCFQRGALWTSGCHKR